MGRTRGRVTVSLVAGLIVLAVFLVVSRSASASVVTGPTAQATPLAPSAPPAAANNQVCLGCHSNASQQMKTLNGEIISLYVDPDT